ncbi:hypothetical protein PTKIN_Ptkin14bG0138300 [Pterospermum kingtungense]
MDGCVDEVVVGNFDEEEELCLEMGEVHQQSEHLEFCLVGRFLSDRAINFNVMSNRMASIWRPMKGVHIKEISFKLYLFQFFHQVDMKRVVDGSPWSYNNHVLVLYKLIPGVAPTLVPLFHVDFGLEFMSFQLAL